MKTKKIQNENDNNADNSSLKAAQRRLADCVYLCPRSPLIWFQPQRHRIMLNACLAYVATWWRASGTEWQKTLNVAYFSEWTWSTFDNVNPVKGHECTILTADFNSDRYDSECMMMIMMTTTITINSVYVLYMPYCYWTVSKTKTKIRWKLKLKRKIL